MNKIIYQIIVIIFILSSCTNNKKENLNIDVSNIDIPTIDIQPYGMDLFSLNLANFEKELLGIYPKYKLFLGDRFPNKEEFSPLIEFISDTNLRKIYSSVHDLYVDDSFLEKELKLAFQYYKYYYSDAHIPKVYTYISGLDFERPIQISAEAMIIALDLYLGSDYPSYTKYGIPVYISKRMTSKNIVVDCMKELYKQNYEIHTIPKTFLDEIIHNGKLLYFLEAMLPLKEEHLRLGYTKKQLEWCKQNEKTIWAFFIDKNILYSADYEIIRRFTKDGPFTLSISKEAPANLGNWIGLQIIKSYKNNNPKISLHELLLENNAQNLLKFSSYKPKK